MPPPDTLPELFVQRLRRIVPADRFAACLESFAEGKPAALRVNTLKSDVEAVRQELAEAGFRPDPVAWLPEALLVDPAERRRLAGCAAAAEGRIYLQNLSSMVAALVLDPRPGQEVLDLAAAPGGKTLHVAAMMQNRGRIAAVEAIRSRMFKLRANLRRGGATIARTYLADGRTVGSRTPDRFDRVLLDAPCSGEARFDCGDPATWRFWGLRKIADCARKQRGLLRSAARSLRPGGTLVYCTCSFAPEETEAVVDGLLAAAGDVLRIEPIELPFGNVQPGLTGWDGKEFHPSLADSIRILPDRQMDGLYLCKLVKLRATARPRRRTRRARQTTRTRRFARKRASDRGLAQF